MFSQHDTNNSIEEDSVRLYLSLTYFMFYGQE